jgi:esterase/lipase superfamily enzyme
MLYFSNDLKTLGRGHSLVFAFVAILSGCTTTDHGFILMETPVIYHQAEIDPFAHLDESQKTTSINVFYATNRNPQPSRPKQPYGNGISTRLHVGQAAILMGDPDTRWEHLYNASISPSRERPVELYLGGTSEMASIAQDEFLDKDQILSPSLKNFADAINLELAKSENKALMVYVHGAKFDFFRSCALTAELDHFAGRDFVGIAFSWPSHQTILTYISGIDVHQAWSSTRSFRSLIRFLSRSTMAQTINIISYSAGGRLVSKALFEMRQLHNDLNPEELKNFYKLGAVIFAAADVSVDDFLYRLTAISELARQVVVTVSDDDDALETAQIVMGGEARIGTDEAELIEEEFAMARAISNFEIVDLSRGKEDRGFDITGHHYWYRNPWASSDIIFLLRTDLPGYRRGLSPSELNNVWFFGPDYPDKAKDAVRKEIGSQW